MFVCASSKMNEFIQQTTIKHSCMCVQECTHAGMCVLLHVCVHVCRCSCPITVFLSVGLCALWSPLLAAVHKENCWRLLGFPHSPPEYKTLTHSVLQFTHYTALISFCECVFALIPFTLNLATTQHNILYACVCEPKGKPERLLFSVCAQMHKHTCISHSLLYYKVGCRNLFIRNLCVFMCGRDSVQ